LPGKHAQLPSALAGPPLPPIAPWRGAVATSVPSAPPGVISRRGSGGLLIHHDDPRREFAYGEGADKALTEAKDRGWTIASVQQDAEKIF
jgi:hypothetical protein